MRATQHNGRRNKNGAFNTKHNDRNYDFENAENIFSDKTNENVYYNVYDKYYKHSEKENKLSFEEAEKKYYEEHFKKQWEETNKKYIKNYHKERCKSFEISIII